MHAMSTSMVYSVVDLKKWVQSFKETNKAYLDNSYLKELETRLLGYQEERKSRYYLVFEDTIFHPRTGGQSSDRGFVVGEGFEFVVDKALLVGEVVVHYGKLTKGLLQEGMRVKLILDWNARYKNMRLHTAGHILDYAVQLAYGRVVETVEAYHSPPEPYVVYNAEAPSESMLREIERVANEVVSRDLPVRVLYVPREDLAKVVFNAPNLARLPNADIYRVVLIEGVNAIPCTGTHVAKTSEVGRIRVLEAVNLGGKFKLVYDVE